MQFDQPPLCCFLRLCPTLPSELASQPAWLAAGISTAEAAAFLGLAPSSLETMRVRGGGPPYEKIARRVRYRRSDLLAFKLAATRSSTSSGTRPDDCVACDCGGVP